MKQSYAQVIREALAESKAAGYGFNQALPRALEKFPPPDIHWQAVFGADNIREAFRAAYDQTDHPSRLLHLVQTDTSGAIPDEPRQRKAPVPGGGKCRSGDGCPRDAVMGDPPRWCRLHGEELERLRIEKGEGQGPLRVIRSAA